MALTDEGNGGIPATMLVGPTAMPYYGGQQSGFGNGWGGDGWWIILLFILLGNNGWGGFGGFGGNVGSEIYPWMNQANLTSDGFQNALMNDNITSIRDGVHSLSNQLCNCCGDISTQLCNGFNGVNMAVNGAQNILAQQLYTNQIADLERSFAAQTANTAGMTSLQSQLAQCCCDNRQATADLKYTVATEACADRSAISEALRDVISANTASTQRILDQLCQDKIDAKNEKISELQTQLSMAQLAASQNAQTAAILTDNLAQTNALEQYLAPVPRPAYIVQNPNCCVQNNCGCGSF